MSKYYTLEWQNTPEGVSAFSLIDPPPVYQLINELEGKRVIPFDFELRKVKETSDGLQITTDLSELKEIWPDYLTNNLAWPMMSARLMAIIQKGLTGAEGIDWITVNIRNGNEVKLYYIPRFNKNLDTLDKVNTKMIPGTDQILKAVYSLPKIKSYSVFHEELSHNLWKITPFINLNEAVVKAIKKDKITGLEFSKISVM